MASNAIEFETFTEQYINIQKAIRMITDSFVLYHDVASVVGIIIKLTHYAYVSMQLYPHIWFGGLTYGHSIEYIMDISNRVPAHICEPMHVFKRDAIKAMVAFHLFARNAVICPELSVLSKLHLKGVVP